MSKRRSEDILNQRLSREAEARASADAENARIARQEEERSHQALSVQLDVALARAKELLDATEWPGACSLHRRNRMSLIAAMFGDNTINAVSIGTIYNDGETGDPVRGWLATDGLIYAHDQWSHYESVYLAGKPSWMWENVISGLNNLINWLQQDKPVKTK